jgi:hypothetical protein
MILRVHITDYIDEDELSADGILIRALRMICMKAT